MSKTSRLLGSLVAALALMLPMVAHAAGFDVEHASRAWLDTLQGPARARSDAYFDGRIWIEVIGGVIGVAICWLIIRQRWVRGLRERMERKGWRPWIVYLGCGGFFLLLQSALTLPWALYADFWREKQFGLMNQPLLAWLGDQVTTAILTVIFGSIVLLAIMSVIRAFPRRWWVFGTGIISAFLLAGLMIYPVFVAPLFNTYSELPDGPVRARIVAMAQAHDVPAEHIYVADESRQSDRISANVSGLGPTVRITLNDNLLKRDTVPQVAAVMGHELGHYVLHHQVKETVELALLTAVILWLLARITPALIRRRRWGLRDLADPAAIPVIIGVYSALTLLTLPVTNAIIRGGENEADAFGLEAAREPDAFAAVAMQLSQYRKIEPGTLQEALFYDHPSGRTRVRRAMQWKKDNVPNATEVTPPPLPDTTPHAP